MGNGAGHAITPKGPWKEVCECWKAPTYPTKRNSYRTLRAMHGKHLNLGATADILDVRDRIQNILISQRDGLSLDKLK